MRLRFAPSPTGPFSLGNARTALFNWLYAKKEGGEFVLRIEDTDTERSESQYEQQIQEGLTWLGLNWDGPVTRQSERTELYKTHLTRLLEEGKAYYCFCSSEELEADREARMTQGLPPIYSGTCRDIDPAEARKRAETEPAVIRFKTPHGKVEFTDLVRGTVTFDAALIGDIVIAKNLESPLYNFAVVIDDHDMDITHVIRGEDHLSNTPKQWVIQQALGFEHPTYAHLPLLLGPDKKKLSKRYLTTSLLDYKTKGYLPEAVFNFLLLLGWHPKEDKEVVTRDEALQQFNLDRVQKGGAVFNEEKLDWYNAWYIRNLPIAELLEQLTPFIPDAWKQDMTKLQKAVELERERMKTLADFATLGDFFFAVPAYEPSLLIWKEDMETSKKSLQIMQQFLHELPEQDFTPSRIETQLVTLADELGRGEVYWPLRVALSGKKASPGALDIMPVIGKKETEKRIGYALRQLGANSLFNSHS